MTPMPPPLGWLQLEPPPLPGRALVVARGAGHDRSSLRRAEALGAVVGAAVRAAHGRLDVGPARRGPRMALAELLALARPQTPLMLDLRGVDPRLPRLLARALAAEGARDMIVCSRSWWMLHPLSGRPGVRVVPIVATGRQLGTLLRHCGTEQLDGVAVSAQLLTAETAIPLAAMARTLFAWPVDSPTEATRLRRLGVTALISDRPDVLAGAAAQLAA